MKIVKKLRRKTLARRARRLLARPSVLTGAAVLGIAAGVAVRRAFAH